MNFPIAKSVKSSRLFIKIAPLLVVLLFWPKPGGPWQPQQLTQIQHLSAWPLATLPLSFTYAMNEQGLQGLGYELAHPLSASIPGNEPIPGNKNLLALSPQRTDGYNFQWLFNDVLEQAVTENAITQLPGQHPGYRDNHDHPENKSFFAAIEQVLPELRPLFEKYADQIHWKMLAAVAYQESRWDPKAISPTGVRGIMMLTRTTASEVGVDNRVDPEQSIRGGAQYLQQLIDKVPDSVHEDERIWFALAAYNIGFGHMLDARTLTRRQGANPDSWFDVKQRLPLLSQKSYYPQTRYGYARGHEAYHFVENIRHYVIRLDHYLQQQGRQSLTAWQYAGRPTLSNTHSIEQGYSSTQ